MNWRGPAVGIYKFVLFLIVYTVIGPIIWLAAYYSLDNPVVARLIALWGGAKIDNALVALLAAGLAGLLTVVLAIVAYTLIVKARPSRGIGVAFILWLVSTYVFRSIITNEFVDVVLVETSVASAVAWVGFRLPPLKLPRPDIAGGL